MKLSIVFAVFWIFLFVVRLFKGRPSQRGPTHSFNNVSSDPHPTQSPHQVLGIHQNASKDEIVAAYRYMVQKYHPDKVATLAPEFRKLADLKMKEVNAAYAQLKRDGFI
jgi:preprotein translocase subunit Sec63